MASKAPKELSKQERLNLAIDEYNQAFLAYQNSSNPQKKKPALQPIAWRHGVVSSTLSRRITGQTHSHQEAHVDAQRLTSEEESALVSWIQQMAEWGWPPRVVHVRDMATELLVEKGDRKELGVNWVIKFLDRHQELQSRFSQPLDKERAETHNPEKLLRWFQLVKSIIQKYDIQQEDTYNMNEKGFALGVAGRTKVICSRNDLQVYVTQDGNREWTSLIECISADGRLLKIFMIFKGKQIKKAWTRLLEDKDDFIAMSENGWTNNVLGLEWFIRAFEPQTRRTLKGKYRLLIFDGHSSHISTKVILFCVNNDIILLCLPSHTTHMLQPLDVGFFSPLTTAYRKHLEENTRLAKAYTMDKADYIRLIQMARKNAATHTNIMHAWQKSDLFPIQPQVVFDKWGLKAPETRPITPPAVMTITAFNGNSVSMPFTTPANVKEVNHLVQQIKAGNHDPTLPEKLGKACSSALANNTMLKITNNDLINADQRKQNKNARGKEHWGEAMIMNLEVVQERMEKFGAEQLKKELIKIHHIGLDLFEDTVDTKKGRSRSPVKKTTAGPSTVPPTPGPLVPIWLDPPQLSPRRPQGWSPERSQVSPERQRGDRGGARGGKKTKAKAKAKEVVVEEEEEEVVVKYSRSGRQIKPKK